MTSTDLLILADRVEGLSGPCRETDGAVRKAVVGDFGFCGDGDLAWLCSDCGQFDLLPATGCGAPMGLSDERRSYPSDWRDDDRLPAYTASLDAAMSLVPEGWRIRMLDASVKDRWSWSLIGPLRQSDDPDSRGVNVPLYASGTAKLPAPALVSACLKARTIAANQEPSA